eukprot:jgi/Botrbrau1/19942/Bobra.0059s0059.1
MGVQSARPFFNAVLQKPYRKQVGIAPHFYPPSVSTQTHDTTGKGLYDRLTYGIGYLTKEGFCNGTDCQRFPVVFGEVGSKFTEEGDLAFLEDMAKWMSLSGDGDDGLHNAVPHQTFWCWNSNSGDTGGLVADNWITVQWQKMEWINKASGIQPWYLNPTKYAGAGGTPSVYPLSTPAVNVPTQSPTPTPFPTGATPSPTSTPSFYQGASTPAPTAASVSPSPPPPSTPSPSPEPYDTSAPIPTPVNSSPSLNPPGPCTVVATLRTPWSNNGAWANVMDLSWTSSSTVTAPYQINVGGSYTGVLSSWNWQPLIVDGGVMGTVSQPWQSLISPATNVSVGIIVMGGPVQTPPSLVPTAVAINGQLCSLTTN